MYGGVPIVFAGSDNCGNIYIIEHNMDVIKQNNQATTTTIFKVDDECGIDDMDIDRQTYKKLK